LSNRAGRPPASAKEHPMNVTQMTDDELMAFEPSNSLQAQAVAAELRRRGEAQLREAEELERWGHSRKLDPAQ
jgi:hypothetical protein